MVKDLVPRIHFYDQDFVDMYDRTWVWIDEIWHQGEKEGLFPEGYFTHGDSSVMNLFDASLSALFLVYSNQNYSPYSMIDFFYSMQAEDGQIAEKYDIDTKAPVFDSDNPLGVSLPLLSYVEFVFYHKIGNKKRLKDVVPFLEKYFAWIQKNFMDKDGLYSVPAAATHMGNLPREGAVFTVDYNAAIAVFALYMSYIGDILNDKELAFRYKRIYFSVKTRINSMMWDPETKFYYDLDGNGERIMNKQEKEVSLQNLVEQYLQEWVPAAALTDEGAVVRTTDDILRDLDDMADLVPNDVAMTMLSLGFRSAYYPDGRHGWLMKPVK